MKNEVISGLALNDEVRFYLADTKEMVTTVIEKNNAYPIAATVLARTSSITALMGLMLKGDQEITTIIESDGELGKIISIAKSNGDVRSLVANPQLDLPLVDGHLDIKSGVGTIGNLKVVKDLKMREPYVSETSIISGEVNPDFTYYFSYSEQTPTAISSGVIFNDDFSVNTAGALIVQVLPNATDDTIEKLDQMIKSLKPVEILLQDLSLEEILTLIFANDFRILATDEINYRCVCSQERFIDGIRLLNATEIEDIKNDDTIECTCNFCSTKYLIDTTLI
jgi:molecular chaperone Hsp33